MFLMIFRRFPTTSQRFSKIFPKARRTFPNIFREFPKISEDVRRLPKTFEEDPKMFRWYSNDFKYNLRDKLDISEIIDIFTCEDIVSFLSICYPALGIPLTFHNIITWRAKLLNANWLRQRAFFLNQEGTVKQRSAGRGHDYLMLIGWARRH